MKAVVRASLLANALALATSLAAEDKRAKKPVWLDAVQMIAANDVVWISAHVGDFMITITLPSPCDEGALTLSGARLAALAAGFPGDANLEISTDGAAARVAFRRSRFKLAIIPPDQIPAPLRLVEEIGCVELTRADALRAFARPSFA